MEFFGKFFDLLRLFGASRPKLVDSILALQYNKDAKIAELWVAGVVHGHCISVDPWFLVGDYPGLARVVNESMKTNEAMPEFVLNRIHQIMKENGITDLDRVGLYGLSYKENADDPRESRPSASGKPAKAPGLAP